MKLSAVMGDLGNALKTVPGLRVRPYGEQLVTPPTAQVYLPRNIDYDSTMARGCDEMDVPVVVFVSRTDAEQTVYSLDLYVDGANQSFAIKHAIESYQSAIYDYAHVPRCEFPVASVGGISYQTATFLVHIVGPGSEG